MCRVRTCIDSSLKSAPLSPSSEVGLFKDEAAATSVHSPAKVASETAERQKTPRQSPRRANDESKEGRAPPRVPSPEVAVHEASLLSAPFLRLPHETQVATPLREAANKSAEGKGPPTRQSPSLSPPKQERQTDSAGLFLRRRPPPQLARAQTERSVATPKPPPRSRLLERQKQTAFRFGFNPLSAAEGSKTQLRCSVSCCAERRGNPSRDFQRASFGDTKKTLPPAPSATVAAPCGQLQTTQLTAAGFPRRTQGEEEKSCAAEAAHAREACSLEGAGAAASSGWKSGDGFCGRSFVPLSVGSSLVEQTSAQTNSLIPQWRETISLGLSSGASKAPHSKSGKENSVKNNSAPLATTEGLRDVDSQQRQCNGSCADASALKGPPASLVSEDVFTPGMPPSFRSRLLREQQKKSEAREPLKSSSSAAEMQGSPLSSATSRGLGGLSRRGLEKTRAGAAALLRERESFCGKSPPAQAKDAGGEDLNWISFESRVETHQQKALSQSLPHAAAAPSVRVFGQSQINASASTRRSSADAEFPQRPLADNKSSADSPLFEVSDASWEDSPQALRRKRPSSGNSSDSLPPTRLAAEEGKDSATASAEDSAADAVLKESLQQEARLPKSVLDSAAAVSEPAVRRAAAARAAEHFKLVCPNEPLPAVAAVAARIIQRQWRARRRVKPQRNTRATRDATAQMHAQERAFMASSSQSMRRLRPQSSSDTAAARHREKGLAASVAIPVTATEKIAFSGGWEKPSESDLHGHESPGIHPVPYSHYPTVRGITSSAHSHGRSDCQGGGQNFDSLKCAGTFQSGSAVHNCIGSTTDDCEFKLLQQKLQEQQWLLKEEHRLLQEQQKNLSEQIKSIEKHMKTPPVRVPSPSCCSHQEARLTPGREFEFHQRLRTRRPSELFEVVLFICPSPRLHGTVCALACV